jgi:ankyrin repeat protein
MAAPYKYKPLSPEPGRIRLLRLFKAYPTDPLRCELVEACLYGDDAPVYQALSYTWGSNAVVESITIEEEDASGLMVSSSLHITFNLHTALRYIRSRDLDLVLWIDAVCIDQQNAQEKGDQIGQMKFVYEQAEQVLIWLGLGNLNASAVMDAMCRFHKEATIDMEAWKDPEMRPKIASPIIHRELSNAPIWDLAPIWDRSGRLEEVKDLFRSPWFQRVWIIQEVASARAATVHCGSRSVPADVFALMPSLLKFEVDKQVQAVLDVLPGHPRDESWWTKRRDLLYLLKKFASSKTSEPQDKIYALLGISSDASDTSVFRPDYEISFEDTVRDTLSFLVLGSTQIHRTDEKIRLPKFSLSSILQSADTVPPRDLVMRVLRWAVSERHEHTVKMLLMHNGVDIDRTLLRDLMERGAFDEVVEYIIQHGDFNPKERNQRDETLLDVAVRKKDGLAARLILQRAGIHNIEVAEGGVLSSLEVARRHLTRFQKKARQHISAMRKMSAVNEIDPNIWEGLKDFSEYDRSIAMPPVRAPVVVPGRVPGVYRTPLKVPHAENDNDASLSSAVNKDDVEELRRLVHCGVYPSRYRDAWGGTLLSLAASMGSIRAVRFLLWQMRGAVGVDSRDIDGRTALSFAAEKGHLDVVALLMSHGADTAAKDLNGRRIVDWLEDATEKGPNWGSRLAAWRVSLYGSELAI